MSDNKLSADIILKRLLADVDDNMEFLDSVFNPKDHAAQRVTKSLDKAKAQLFSAIEEMIDQTPSLGASHPHLNGYISSTELRQSLRAFFNVEEKL